MLTSVALLNFAPSITGKGFTVPSLIDSLVVTGCLFGGQAGAYLNNRFTESTMMMLISVYPLVGVFVLVRTLFLGGAAH